MRKITVLSMISLDGVMQGPGGPGEDTSGGFKLGGWTVSYGDEAFNEIMTEEMKASDYLFGRKTFDIFESYWPKHAEIWPAVNKGNKYVLSTTRDKSGWEKSSFLKGLEEIKQLKNSDGADIQVWGSSELIHLLLQHDLVDELRIKVYPLILGSGKKLFADGAMPAAFTLTDSQVTSKGVFVGTYKRAGDVVTGDVGP